MIKLRFDLNFIGLFLFNKNKSDTMKTIKNLLLVLLGLFAINANAQTDKTTTSKIVPEKNYVFVATTAIPTNSADISNVLSKMSGNTAGGSISLNGSNYELKITPDSVIAYLPYYGRAYTAPMGNDDGGIKFTSTKFTYESAKTKKGWQVTIAIKDTKDNERLNLNIGANGYAALNVSTNTKQSISFNGYIAERKQKN